MCANAVLCVLALARTHTHKSPIWIKESHVWDRERCAVRVCCANKQNLAIHTRWIRQINTNRTLLCLFHSVNLTQLCSLHVWQCPSSFLYRFLFYSLSVPLLSVARTNEKKKHSFHKKVPKHSIVIVDFILKYSPPDLTILLISISPSHWIERQRQRRPLRQSTSGRQKLRKTSIVM